MKNYLQKKPSSYELNLWLHNNNYEFNFVNLDSGNIIFDIFGMCLIIEQDNNNWLLIEQ